jgi:hypothetical protein
VDLSGVGQMMGAVPGGFQQGQIANNQIDQGQLQVANERAKQVGMQAYFRALQGMFNPTAGVPGQTPQPGQPSVSMAQHAMPGPSMGSPRRRSNRPCHRGCLCPVCAVRRNATTANWWGSRAEPTWSTVTRSSRAVDPPQPQMSWQGIVQSLKQQNPAASDLELAHAVDHFMPMMTMQNKLEWQQMRNELMWEMTKMRTDTTARGQDVRASTAERGQDTRADTTNRRTDVIGQQEEGRQGRFDTSEDRRNRALDQRGEQFKQREDRLERGLQLRSDQGWQRLQQAKDQAQQRIQQGDRRQAVIDWRAAVDAQHKMAMEKIQANSTMNSMKPADREKLLKDQNEWYRGEIEKLKNLTTQRGNISDQGTPAGQSTTDVPPGQPLPGAKPAASAAAGGQPLPAAFKDDPDGTKYQKDGKTWIKSGDQLVIENGG